MDDDQLLLNYLAENTDEQQRDSPQVGRASSAAQHLPPCRTKFLFFRISVVALAYHFMPSWDLRDDFPLPSNFPRERRQCPFQGNCCNGLCYCLVKLRKLKGVRKGLGVVFLSPEQSHNPFLMWAACWALADLDEEKKPYKAQVYNFPLGSIQGRAS